MSKEKKVEEEEWPDDWPVQPENPCDASLEQPTLSTGAAVRSVSGSDIYLQRKNVLQQKCLFILPGLLSLKNQATKKAAAPVVTNDKEALKVDATASTAKAENDTTASAPNGVGEATISETPSTTKEVAPSSSIAKDPTLNVLGRLERVQTGEPVLTLGNTTNSLLTLQGRKVETRSKFLVLQLIPAKKGARGGGGGSKKQHVVCKGVFTSVTVFGQGSVVETAAEDSNTEHGVAVFEDATSTTGWNHYGGSTRAVDGSMGRKRTSLQPTTTHAEIAFRPKEQQGETEVLSDEDDGSSSSVEAYKVAVPESLPKRTVPSRASRNRKVSYGEEQEVSSEEDDDPSSEPDDGAIDDGDSEEDYKPTAKAKPSSRACAGKLKTERATDEGNAKGAAENPRTRATRERHNTTEQATANEEPIAKPSAKEDDKPLYAATNAATGRRESGVIDIKEDGEETTSHDSHLVAVTQMSQNTLVEDEMESEVNAVDERDNYESDGEPAVAPKSSRPPRSAASALNISGNNSTSSISSNKQETHEDDADKISEAESSAKHVVGNAAAKRPRRDPKKRASKQDSESSDDDEVVHVAADTKSVRTTRPRRAATKTVSLEVNEASEGNHESSEEENVVVVKKARSTRKPAMCVTKQDTDSEHSDKKEIAGTRMRSAPRDQPALAKAKLVIENVDDSGANDENEGPSSKELAVASLKEAASAPSSSQPSVDQQQSAAPKTTGLSVGSPLRKGRFARKRKSTPPATPSSTNATPPSSSSKRRRRTPQKGSSAKLAINLEDDEFAFLG